MGRQSDFVRFMRYVDINIAVGSCWEWKGRRSAFGYGIFYTKKNVRAHRWLYQFLNLPVQDDQILRHRCDNPWCVNPDHLVPGTHQDNMNDMMERGRHSGRIGENNVRAKMTEDKVRQIRDLVDGGMEHMDVSRQFGIGTSQVARIARREQWRHIK